MAKEKKTKLKNLFENNKFTLAFSFVLAFIIWISVAMVFSPQSERVIEVPVKIQMENSAPEKFNLQLFGETEFTVDVKISGKRYVVGSDNINADSIEVIAQTGYVDSAGKKQLPLKASLVDTTAEYEIVSISEEYIEAYFDEYKEAKFPIKLKFDYNGEVIPEGYVQGDPLITLNSETITEVEITGAAQQINSIENVYAYAELKKPLTETTVLEAEIIPKDEFGSSLKYIKINGEDSPKVNVTVPVLKVAELSTAVDFSGVPTVYTTNLPSVEITPSNVKVAMPDDSLKSLKSLILKEIPFSSLDSKENVFVISKEEIENSNLKILDDTTEFRVTVDLSHMAHKTMELTSDRIEIINNNTTKEITLDTENISMVVVGPEDTIESITTEEVIAQINLNNVKINDGVNEVELKLSLNNYASCWVYGEYTAKLLAK